MTENELCEKLVHAMRGGVDKSVSDVALYQRMSCDLLPIIRSYSNAKIEDLRQQNAALVSALREAVSLISGHGTNYQTYGELKRKWMAALAAHAPAEAEAKTSSNP